MKNQDKKQAIIEAVEKCNDTRKIDCIYAYITSLMEWHSRDENEKLHR
jgi:hypothetical protein